MYEVFAQDKPLVFLSNSVFKEKMEIYNQTLSLGISSFEAVKGNIDKLLEDDEFVEEVIQRQRHMQFLECRYEGQQALTQAQDMIEKWVSLAEKRVPSKTLPAYLSLARSFVAAQAYRTPQYWIQDYQRLSQDSSLDQQGLSLCHRFITGR